MPTASADARFAGDPEAVAAAVRRPETWGSLAPHVVQVTQTAPGRVAWDVRLNGSLCSWTEDLSEPAPGTIRFTQLTGEVERLRSTWTVRPVGPDVELRLDVDFTLGVDGLAPLLDPIWTQSFQAHARAVVDAVTRSCRTTRTDGGPS